jgi:hypothetical protein
MSFFPTSKTTNSQTQNTNQFVCRLVLSVANGFFFEIVMYELPLYVAK